MLDSTYWDRFTPRDGDIVISTSIKAGTTWMQRICATLAFQSPELALPMDAYSPWLDYRTAYPEFVIPLLEAQTHRRFIKSHLPLDALKFFANVNYIVVCRDARDVFMSMVNHHRNLTVTAIEEISAHDGAELLAYRQLHGIATSAEEREAILNLRRWEGEEIPLLEDVDIHEYWRLWITRSVYSWERDGYPYWSHFHHLASWWPFRTLSNILFVHYNDLLVDLDGQMRRISDWLRIDVDEAIWPSLVEAATFSEMKRSYEKTTPVVTRSLWRDPENFFHKGSNGRWRDVLSDEELTRYDVAADRSLVPEATRWMEQGSLAFADPRLL
jgi:aryl sulfotransferase